MLRSAAASMVGAGEPASAPAKDMRELRAKFYRK